MKGLPVLVGFGCGLLIPVGHPANENILSKRCCHSELAQAHGGGVCLLNDGCVGSEQLSGAIELGLP